MPAAVSELSSCKSRKPGDLGRSGHHFASSRRLNAPIGDAIFARNDHAERLALVPLVARLRLRAEPAQE